MPRAITSATGAFVIVLLFSTRLSSLPVASRVTSYTIVRSPAWPAVRTLVVPSSNSGSSTYCVSYPIGSTLFSSLTVTSGSSGTSTLVSSLTFCVDPSEASDLATFLASEPVFGVLSPFETIFSVTDRVVGTNSPWCLISLTKM